MVGICSYGAYVPLYRLAREMMVLEGKGGAGERSVAGADEDALTMAVDAILDCTNLVTVFSRRTSATRSEGVLRR
jgi:3-hydroxy-3-methylglutaryl CoA synthase